MYVIFYSECHLYCISSYTSFLGTAVHSLLRDNSSYVVLGIVMQVEGNVNQILLLCSRFIYFVLNSLRCSFPNLCFKSALRLLIRRNIFLLFCIFIMLVVFTIFFFHSGLSIHSFSMNLESLRRNLLPSLSCNYKISFFFCLDFSLSNELFQFPANFTFSL